MSWVRIDDAAMRHPKLMRAIREKGPAAAGMWLAVLCHCASGNTCGLVEHDLVPLLMPCIGPDDALDLVECLADVGLLDRDESDFIVHDWDHYQGEDAALALERRREATRARVRRFRARQRTENTEDACNATGSARGRYAETLPGNAPDPADPADPTIDRGRKRRGTRLPDDWAPSPDLVEYARTSEHVRFGAREVARCAEDFRDYWHAKAGATATKLDWDATFRTWLRNERKRNPALPVAAAGAAPTGARVPGSTQRGYWQAPKKAPRKPDAASGAPGGHPTGENAAQGNLAPATAINEVDR